MDEIDGVLAKHYGFTEEELDFIINYDIKYRMGKDNGDKQGGKDRQIVAVYYVVAQSQCPVLFYLNSNLFLAIPFAILCLQPLVTIVRNLLFRHSVKQ